MVVKKICITLFLVVLVMAPMLTSAQDSPVEVTFWHAMSGSRAEVVDALINQFNEENPDVHVNAVFTGSYEETLTSALAAVGTGEEPHIVQVYEVGTRTMLDSGAIVPVMEVSGGELDIDAFVSPITSYYSIDGDLRCMPFNSSTAMLYYNKDMFRDAGLDPDSPPTTYEELYEAGRALIDAGVVDHAISFGWPAWIMEQTFAMHDQFLANEENGRSGLATETFYNSEFGVQVLSEWQRWADNDVMSYGGRNYSANDPFIAGEFAMLAQSTSSLGGIQNNVDFDLGTAFLPRLDGYEVGNNVIGGGCLWALKGFSEEEYQGIWRFFQFLSQPEQSITWHKGTGYFPATNEAVDALEAEGWFDENPNFRTAFDQILAGNNTPAAQGVLLGDFVTIRDIVGAAIEEAVVEGRDPQESLDDAVDEINSLLEDYAALNG